MRRLNDPLGPRTKLAAAVAVLVVSLGVTLTMARRSESRASACATYAQRVAAESASAHAARQPQPAPRLDHVVLIVMENKECSQVAGSGAAPYFNSLAKHSALLPVMYAATHPSLPNYLALVSGQTFGATDSCAHCAFRARTLADQLDAAGLSWRAYLESIPGPCFHGRRAGLYARRHNPLMLFAAIANNPARCRNVVPLARLRTDLHARRLPRFAWVSPNLCHDMHDCGVAEGDAFLKRAVPAILAGLGPRDALIITWDEGTTNRGCCRLARGGNIPTLITGGAVLAGARPFRAFSTYSILRTLEDGWGLRRLGGAACACTPVISGVWRDGVLSRSGRSPRPGSP